MIKVTRPKNLNGTELLAELNAKGVTITEPPMLDGNGDLFLQISESDVDAAELVLAKHNGTQVAPEPTIAQKLTTLGINLDDLKAALL
jgi:hypothetical protein